MSSMHHSLRHYKEEHYRTIEKAETYEELSEAAIDILKSMPKPIGIVCGPISTGGAGNIKANLEVFEKTVHKLADEGQNIFNQMPFEKGIKKLREKYGKLPEEKNQILLDRFYLLLYQSGLIKKMYFIQGWESSHGAKWERKVSKELGIEIEDLPGNFLEL
jgi:hypothetical protein